MDSLRDALEKAGLKGSPKQRKSKGPKKKPQRKGPPPPKPAAKPRKQHNPGNSIHDHHMRSVCEHCHKTSPDVEYYNHELKSVSARWICIPCADDLKIHDDCRTTAQSDFSLRKTFRRLYGPTRRFPPKKKP